MQGIVEILRELFQNPLPGKDSHRLMAPSRIFTGEKYPDPRFAKDSSVFIILFKKDGQIYIPLIKRTEYVGAHSGQISLPGGKYEPTDKSLLDTAYRETEEEIGISREMITYTGTLTTLYIPNSNFNVVPHVGVLNGEPIFTPNKREVERIITLPLRILTDNSSIKRFERTVHGKVISAPYYSYKDNRIWGATAMILSEFAEMIKHSSLIGETEDHYSL